jgi:branched-chain amino acid transport system substrate-binding protein
MWTHVLIAVVAMGALAAPGVVPAAEKGPIKIGFTAPLTGTFAQVGKDMLNGFELYFEEIGKTASGRKIELIVEDNEGTPATALTKVRKLVEKDGVHVVAGGLLASTGYALAPYVDAQRIPTLYPVMAPDDLTQRKPANWIVRTGWSSSQPSHPFGEYAAKVLGYKKIAVIAMDYAFGWEVTGGFQKTFEEQGGQIVQKIWTPLNVTDYAPYLGQLRKDVDAVFGVHTGRLTLQFVKQYQEFGLKAKIPLIGGGVMTDEFGLPSMGDEALGIITTLHYSEALDTPANKKFKAAFEKKAGKIASYYSENPYDGARWIVEGIKAVNGNVEDRDRFLAALRKVEITDAPRGPMKMDSDNNPIQNVYIRKVERVGGRLQNTVIQTFPNVSQYWKYNREEFLKQPVYDRNFPPCKFCQ